MSPANNGPRHLPRARGLAAAAALLLAGSLAACGPADTGLQHDAARQLQERVLGVSEAAAALDGLEADLAAAVGNGQVSEDRRRSIMTAAAAVRADLTAAKSAADAAAAEAAAAQQQAAAAEAAKVAPAPAAPAPAESKGNDGKGKGKD